MREGEDPLDAVAFSFAGGGHKGNQKKNKQKGLKDDHIGSSYGGFIDSSSLGGGQYKKKDLNYMSGGLSSSFGFGGSGMTGVKSSISYDQSGSAPY